MHLVNFFSPIFGGSAFVPYNLSKTLAKRGHHVIIFTSDYKISQEWIDSLPNINIFTFKTLFNFKKFLITPSMLKNTKERIKEVDVIHMHNYRTFQNIVIHHYAKMYGVPYVLQAHGSLPRINAKFILKWIYDIFFGYRLLKDAAKVIALNKVEAEQYMSMRVPDDKIEIIPNGIDLSEYTNLPTKGFFKKKFGIGEEEKIVLYLGRIHRIKGIDFLVKSFARILKLLKNVKLVIVGPDNGCLCEIEYLIKFLGIEDNVLITGPLYDMDKLEAFVDADLYVLPSRYEIFGMTVLEAYSCSKPVVASKVGGLKELVVDGETGLLFEPENIEQLYESLLSLLEDNAKAEKMGLKGKQFVKEKFTIENFIDQIEVLYEEIALI